LFQQGAIPCIGRVARIGVCKPDGAERRFDSAATHCPAMGQEMRKMSDDNKKTVSEETISAIVGAATHIAADSDAMRQNLVAIAEAMQPIIQRAGIRFGSLEESQMWAAGSYPETWTKRIGIKRSQGKFLLGREETQYYPERWDGSNWIGHRDPFSDDAYSNGAAMITPFSQISRRSVACAIERIPDFIDAYCAELKRRHQRYSDLREKAEQIRKILEG
jgi:hypothetical protein